MGALQDLAAAGQSVWYDNIRRALLDSGELASYLDRYAVTGVTSNPTILEQAIAAGGDCEQAIDDALHDGIEDPEAIFWRLAIRDERDALLPPDLPTVAVEAASPQGWREFADEVVGMDGFGASGAADALYEHFHITPEAVAARVRGLLDTR